MRSRFSAFALGEDAYLWRTLDPDHVDKQRDEATVLRELRDVRQKHRYVRLAVQSFEADGDSATVQFRAEVYAQGKDRSFTERSLFRRHDGHWRYWKGDAVE